MLGRLSALATIAMMLACGGDPAPLEVKKPKAERGSDEARAERKRKKAEERKRQEQEEADAREREEREARRRKREEEAQESQEPQEKRVAEKEESAASDDPDEIERRERKERIRQREEEEARIAKADAKKEKREAARVAKLEKAEAEKAKKAKKKKNVEEVDEDEEEDAADESDEEVATEEEGAKASPFKKGPKKQTAAEKKAAAKKLAAEKAAEKTAAEKQAAADRAAEKKAAADAKKQAAADKAAEKKAAAEAKKQAAEEKKAEEVADESEEDAAEEEKPKQVTRKGKAKPDEEKVDESEIDVDTASLPPPDPEHESDELDLTAGTPVRAEEPVTVAEKIYAIDRRPLTLGRGKIDVHGGLVATAVTTKPAMGAATTASAQGLALGATYGIGAKGELGIDYTLGLHPGDAQGPFMFHGAYVAKQTEKLDIALSLGLAFDFVDSIDPGTMMTTTRTAKALQVGVWARYHLGARLSAFSGLPALPSSAGNLGAAAPLPPIPYQLSVGLSSVDAIALDIPVGLGYQATPKLYAFGVLDLAHLGMNNTTSAVLFSDFIPLSLGGFYAAKKMDVGAVFSDDLKQGADYLRFDVVVRYSIK